MEIYINKKYSYKWMRGSDPHELTFVVKKVNSVGETSVSLTADIIFYKKNKQITSVGELLLSDKTSQNFVVSYEFLSPFNDSIGFPDE